MAAASASSRAAISCTEPPLAAASAKAVFIRSIAQNRLTAVGRVAAISSHSRWNSVVNCLVPVAALRRAPSASPMAAATPMAGAPRITIVVIALATSFAVRQVTYTSAPGSLRWSIITIASSVRSMVGSIAPSLQEATVEGQRQQVLHLMPAGDAAEIGEHHLEVAAELPQDLPARTTRRCRRVGV